MLRFKSNCNVILVDPSVLDEVIYSGRRCARIAFQGVWPPRTPWSLDSRRAVRHLPEGREIHLWKRGYGQEIIRDGPGEAQGHGEQRRRDGAMNKGRGNTHSSNTACEAIASRRREVLAGCRVYLPSSYQDGWTRQRESGHPECPRNRMVPSLVTFNHPFGLQ